MLALFQFHKGSIKTIMLDALPQGPFNFNSIKVRLRPLQIVVADHLLRFQFHKGSIKTRSSDGRAGQSVYFNSIKVRLRLVPSQGVEPCTRISIP